jgi:hypothetical protein
MFGKQNASPISEALEDFLRRSLDPLETGWERVLLTFRLRTKSEPYKHWGMEQTYGEVAAREALGQAHLQVVKKMLATDLSKTFPDLEAFAAKSEIAPETAVELINAEHSGLPPALSKTEAAHLAVELETLRALTRR